MYNYNQICEVLKIKTMTDGYDDHSPQTIPLKTMYLGVLQTLQFCCYQHKVQIDIGEHSYQDFRAKLVSDPILSLFLFIFLSIVSCATEENIIDIPTVSQAGHPVY